MKKIYTNKAPEPIGPYSQAIFSGNILFCSGQIPLDAKTGEIAGNNIEEQTQKVCQNIEAILQHAGLSFENVIKTTCFLQNMQDFAGFNKVYAKYFVSNPARSCVAAAQLPKSVLVEIEVVAEND